MRRESQNGLLRALRYAAKTSLYSNELLDAAAEVERLREELSERDAAITFLTATRGRLEATRKAQREEIERLKALWYADASPEETEYAEEYLSGKEGKV